MKATSKILVTVLCAILAIPGLAVAADGTNSGGGGSTVESQSGQRVLVDLYNFKLSRHSGITLTSASLKKYKTDYLCIACGSRSGLLARDQKLTSFVKEALSTLAVNFPEAAFAIATELKTPVIVLSGEAPKLNSISLSANVDLNAIPQESWSSAKLAAYFQSDKLVGISAVEFNRLALEDQAGLLIHEALRTMQKQFSRSISNREIQDLVLAIISQDAQAQQNQAQQIKSLTEVYSGSQVEKTKQAACQAMNSFTNWKFPNAAALCAQPSDKINLQMTLSAWKDVHSARAEMLRTAQSDVEVKQILGMVDNFESLFLKAATNGLAKNDSVFSGIVRSGKLNLKLVDIDIYNGR